MPFTLLLCGVQFCCLRGAYWATITAYIYTHKRTQNNHLMDGMDEDFRWRNNTVAIAIPFNTFRHWKPSWKVTQSVYCACVCCVWRKQFRGCEFSRARFSKRQRRICLYLFVSVVRKWGFPFYIFIIVWMTILSVGQRIVYVFVTFYLRSLKLAKLLISASNATIN